MTEVLGYNGEVDWATIIDSDQSYNTYSWSADITSEAHDVTNFDSTGWRKFLAGLKGWSGTVEMYIDSDTTYHIQPSDVGSSAALKLYLDSTHYITGSAICTGWHPAVAVDGVETQTLDFQGASDLTYA